MTVFIFSKIESASSKNKWRLPNVVSPFHYTIHLEPNFSELNFKGNLQILFMVKKDTNSISFHKEAIDISKITLNTTIIPMYFLFLKKFNIL